MLARLDRRSTWFDSPRTVRFECLHAQAGLEARTLRSTDQERSTFGLGRTWRGRVVGSDRRFVRGVRSLTRDRLLVPLRLPIRPPKASHSTPRPGQPRFGASKPGESCRNPVSKALLREKPQFIGETTHDPGVMIERIRRSVRGPAVPVCEARVIGRDDLIAIGEILKKRFEPPQ